jgi:hypothetical protein
MGTFASIPKDEAQALRARIAEHLKGEPRRSAKRTAIRKAYGASNFNKFMAGGRGASNQGRARVLAILDGGPAPTRRPGVGRQWRYVSIDESQALRAEAMKHIREKHASVGAFLLARMGLQSKSQSGWYQILKGSGPITVTAAAKLRAALDGRPVAPPMERAPKAEAPSTALALANHGGPRTRGRPKGRATKGRAPHEVQANLRLDAGHVLAVNYRGSVSGLARDLEMTASRLSRFLDGGPLTLDESAELASGLARLRPVESVSPAPGVTMLRASAHGMSIEAVRHAGVGMGGAGDLEPPEVRARRFVERNALEVFSIVLQLAGGAS